MKLKLVLLALGTLLGLCAITGCGGSPIVVHSSSSVSRPTMTPDDAYLRVYHKYVHGYYGPDRSLISLGHTVCGAFDKGLSFEQAAQDGLNVGMPAHVIGIIIGDSIGAYCPQYAYLIPSS